MRKIGFIGSGPVARNLAALATAAGHLALLSSRTPSTLPDGSIVTSFTDVADEAEVVILAIPFRACATTVPTLASMLSGKVVVDATNPLHPDYSPIILGTHTSAAEQIASLLPRSRVVKAFNMIFADVMHPDKQQRAGQRATVFVAGDEPDATSVVAELGNDIGFAPILAGPLASARYLEAMAHLNIQIAFGLNGGSNAAFIYHQAGAA
jgi:8-hydroxy-5-deazaflavin:NADPH oxidoreductase